MFQPTLLTCTALATATFLLRYKDTFTSLFALHYHYLPALVTKPIVSELFLYPDINLIERHLLLGGGHGQADQRRVGVGGLGAPIIREVQVLQINLKCFFSIFPSPSTCDNNLKC